MIADSCWEVDPFLTERLKRQRRSVRLRAYNYSWPGAYFVTICSLGMKCIFGQVLEGEMPLSRIGQLVFECWSATPRHFKNIQLDEFTIMPNHFHGILFILASDPMKSAIPRWKGISPPVVGAIRRGGRRPYHAELKDRACPKALFPAPLLLSLAHSNRLRRTEFMHGEEKQGFRFGSVDFGTM